MRFLASKIQTIIQHSILIFTVFMGVCSASAFASEEIVKNGQAFVQAERALSRWQLSEAIQLSDEIQQYLPETPMSQALLGRIAFHQGDFNKAQKLLSLAAESGMADPKLLALAKAADQEIQHYTEFSSAHYILRLPKGKDEVLADVALQTLEIAFTKITKLFNFVPDHKIMVHILQDTAGLAAITPLSQKDIETSGTIALCKYNRLMIVSPKALARGYSWLETLTHELIHLILSEKTKNSVPIWLHEGIAKYYQSVWHGPAGKGIHAVSEDLLAKALKKDELITFEAMYPSMAKLPSQEATTLAFAEVFTMVEFLQSKGFTKSYRKTHVINTILEELKRGQRLEKAIKEATGFSLKKLQKLWKKYLRTRKFTLVRGQKAKRLEFIKRSAKPNSEEDISDEQGREDLENTDPKQQQALNFIRIADLLRKQKRRKAAIIEYQKAYKKMTTPSLRLNRRLANLLIQAKKFKAAQKIIEKSIDIFNDDPQLHVSLAYIYEQQEEYEKAKLHYNYAIWENPFHPVIYRGLKNIAKLEKDTEAEQKNTVKLQMLSR